jgi:hypothetical protein
MTLILAGLALAVGIVAIGQGFLNWFEEPDYIGRDTQPEIGR